MGAGGSRFSRLDTGGGTPSSDHAGRAHVHRRDPWAREAEFDTDVCYIWDPRKFNWLPFQRRPKEELVIYQLHVGTFTGVTTPS